jgi:hypothetical protein
MNTTPIVFMIVSMLVIWGTLISSIVFLVLKPEVATWPAGGPADTEDLSMN